MKYLLPIIVSIFVLMGLMFSKSEVNPIEKTEKPAVEESSSPYPAPPEIIVPTEEPTPSGWITPTPNPYPMPPAPTPYCEPYYFEGKYMGGICYNTAP